MEPSPRRALARTLPVLAVALALAGCGSSSSSSSGGSSAAGVGSSSSTAAPAPATGGAAPAGATVKVSIKNLAFNPATIHVKVGQTVTWTNDDSPPHNVMYASGPKFANSPEVMNPGAKYSVKFTQPGTVSYYCSIHPFMKATVVVSG